MAPPYSKSRSHGPTPHTLSKTDHPRGPDQEKDRHLKKYSTRSKKTSYSLGLRGQSCLPSACHALVYTARDRMGGRFCPVAVWSLRGGNDCHIRLLRKAKVGDLTPPTPAGAEGP